MRFPILSLLLTFGASLGLFCPPSAVAGKRPTVMVLYFDNNTGTPSDDALAKGLADMMITDLAAVPSVQVVEREKLNALLAELKLQQSKYFDAKTAQRLGKGLGAQYAVTGAFVSVDPTLRIDVRLIRVDSSAVVKAASVTGSKNDFFQLHEQLAARLVEGLADVVSPADAQKMTDTARANHVSKLSSVVDFGKALDANDRGDLDGASKHLQKVVTSEPAFALGKSRYSEIMKALYKAKDRREGLLSKSETDLIAHAEAVFSKRKPTDHAHVSYRIVLSQYYLERVHKAVAKGEPVRAWQSDMRSFVEQQKMLIAETAKLSSYPGGSDLESVDVKLAEDLGIGFPGNTSVMSSPSEVMRNAARTVMFADASLGLYHLGASEAQKMPCPFTLDPSYGATAVGWLESALAHIAKHENSYRERETMRTLRELAKALALLGRTEEGIAKLQAGLDAHPKSDEFEDNEKLLRELLERPPHVWCKTK